MKQFKVLSIDGGGIKGLYSAKILSLLEADLQRLHGDTARIVDYDLRHLNRRNDRPGSCHAYSGGDDLQVLRNKRPEDF